MPASSGNTPKPPRPGSKFRLRLGRKGLILCALLVLAALGATWGMLAPSDKGGSDGPTTTVIRGALQVTIKERGEIFAEKRKIITNEIPFPVIIRQVVPNGTLVGQGEVIIQFECKELIDQITRQRLDVTAADSAYTQAREQLNLKLKEADSRVGKAEYALEEAIQNQRKYLEGDYPIKLADADNTAQLAQRDLALAEKKLNFKLEVNQDPTLNSPYSANEIETDTLNVARLKSGLEKAQRQLDVLKKYDDPRDRRKLEVAEDDARLDPIVALRHE